MSAAMPIVAPGVDPLAETRADARPLPGRGAIPVVAVATHTLFLPVLLLALAVVSWSGFQTFQLLKEREQLTATFDAQQAQVDAAIRVRANLDALAASTQRLANTGDTNARTVVAALRQRGVNINPNPAVPSAPSAGPVR